MKLERLAETSRAVSSRAGRLDKIERLASVLRHLDAAEAAIGVAYLSGELPQGRIGIGPATLRRASAVEPSGTASLSLSEVDRALGRIAELSGPGSTSEKVRLLVDLFGRATPLEQEFLARLLLGELRQGAQERVILDAVASAAAVSGAGLRRAVMLAGDAGAVATAVLREGDAALAGFSIELFRPVQPMLARPAESIDVALRRLGRAALEFKFDGARLQAHKQGNEVRVFTRRLNDETAALPEIVEQVRALPVEEVILDGEAIALRPDGRPRPFQETMRRFGRSRDVDRLRRELPLTPIFFDCLHATGEPLIDRPGRERFERLEEVVPATLLAPRLEAEDPETARRHYRSALQRGHEGLMAKSLEAPYEAGRRGGGWLKLKPSYSLDLVILAAEWGSGRRQGRLSNLHLGARDADTGELVMVGKTFKGLTDEMLAWQTRRLLELETRRERQVVHVEPGLLAEIAFDGVQSSPRYAGGLALRFARVKGYRPDKSATDADTLQTLRRIHAGDVEPG